MHVLKSNPQILKNDFNCDSVSGIVNTTVV